MLESSPFKRLRLLFCWTCNIAQSIFYYRIGSDDSISLLQFGKGGTEADFPYPNYPAYFPGRSVLLREIPDEVQRVLQEINQDKCSVEFTESELSPAVREMLNQLDRPKHQVGGEPYLSQDNPDDLLSCLNCKKVMPFFAAIGDDAPMQMNFTEDFDTQVLYYLCRECHIVGAYQQCS